MNCSKKISKTFRLCHHLTSGSLPYWNNSELTGFNQFLIIPCIHPKSLDSHSLFANKMCGLKEGEKKKKKKRQRGDCFLHQLFWRIKLRAANLLSQVKVFLKIPGDNWSTRIKAGVDSACHPTHRKAKQIWFRDWETIRHGGTNYHKWNHGSFQPLDWFIGLPAPIRANNAWNKVLWHFHPAALKRQNPVTVMKYYTAHMMLSLGRGCVKCLAIATSFLAYYQITISDRDKNPRNSEGHLSLLLSEETWAKLILITSILGEDSS